jgi:urea transport system permease protein
MRALRHFLPIIVAAFTLLTIATAAARADQFSDALAGFAQDSFSATDASLKGIAASGNPQAAAVITALQNGALLIDPDSKAVYIKAADGSLLDPATGKPAAGAPSADSLKAVRLNNRIRGAIDAAMGALTLSSPDRATRLAAADTVFKSRQVSAVPALKAAIAKETDPEVKKAMMQAEAAATLADTDAPEAERVAAVNVIRDRADPDALALLTGLAADSSPAVRDAAAAAVTSIKGVLAMWGVAQNLWYALSLGSVLLLAAIGLAITFGVMGVINMAHGEMVMLGAYTTFVVQAIIRAHMPWLFDWSLAIAIPLAFLVSGGVGVILERGIIRFLYGRPLETLLATWGVSLILQQGVRTIFGPDNQQVGNPSWMSGAFQAGNITITYNRMWIIVFALSVFVVLLGVLRFSRFGLQTRAVTQNRSMASAMGIRTPWVDALTFGLGSGIAGIAGVALSQIDNVSPNLGQSYIIDSFMVVVFGGVGNLWGTLIAALSLGVANKLLEPFAGAVLGKIVVLVFIILFIQKRPRGLFALKGRAVEA